MTMPELRNEVIDAIAANIELGAAVMSEIAASCEGISSSFTIGIQFSPADIRISGPHDRPPDSAWLR
jgi:hypothetical protein